MLGAMNLDQPEALVLAAHELAGHSAFAVRTVSLDGLGATDAGEIALVDRTGVRAGQILGGALDDVLVELARHTSTSGPHSIGARLVELDVDADAASRAGLTCGGHANVVMQPVDQVPGRWWDAVAKRTPIALITNLDAPHLGSVVVEPDRADPPATEALVARALELLAGGRSQSVLEATDDGRMLLEATLPRPRLVVVGSAALAGDLVELAALLGWEGVHHADAADASVDALGPRDAVVVLDHGLHTTGPVLVAALRGRVGYVGALGSRATQRKRADHLRSLGVSAHELAALHGPAGLDLGPGNRAEIALSICAEITAERAGRSARPLRATDGHIRT
jgi:xanthine dehydrogenase accessory factor